MLVQDRLKRINLKSKRKKTLIKKVIEFGHMFQLDVFMVIQDAEMKKVIEYNSGSTTKNNLFNLERARESLQKAHKKKLVHKYFTDDNYKKFV